MLRRRRVDKGACKCVYGVAPVDVDAIVRENNLLARHVLAPWLRSVHTLGAETRADVERHCLPRSSTAEAGPLSTPYLRILCPRDHQLDTLLLNLD
jgi:hypothetical protein